MITHGKLGESRSQFTPLPTAYHGAAPQVEKEEGLIPPAPIVEPIGAADELPSIDNARQLDYGKINWSRLI